MQLKLWQKWLEKTSFWELIPSCLQCNDFLQGDTIDSVMIMCEDSYNLTEDTVTGTFDAYVEKNGDAWEVVFDDVDQENDAVWTYYGLPAADRQSFKDKFNVKKWFE